MRGQPNRSTHPNVRELAAVFAGGTLGALVRVALAEAFPHGSDAWPWTTFAVNLAGAFVLGWAVTRLPPASYRRPFLGIGVCGALTTFSTLQLELLRMLDANGPTHPLALVYALASLAGGLAAVRVGIALARGGRTRRTA
jgi:fluoride exporter